MGFPTVFISPSPTEEEHAAICLKNIRYLLINKLCMITSGNFDFPYKKSHCSPFCFKSNDR